MESNRRTAGPLPASPSAPASDHVPVVGAGAVIPFRGVRPLSLYATLHRPLVAFPAANDVRMNASPIIPTRDGRCLTAPAGRASPRAVLRRLGHSATIGIAVFCVVYFGLQLLRGVL